MDNKMAIPKITTENDYDNNCFTEMVRRWCERKTTPFKSTSIVVNAAPWLPDAVTASRNKEGQLYLNFYSALRAGFGSLSDEDVNAIIEEWL